MLINSNYGTLADGTSSSVVHPRGKSCSWLIEPKSIVDPILTNSSYIEITFNYMNMDSEDVLTIYGGSDSFAPLLGRYEFF